MIFFQICLLETRRIFKFIFQYKFNFYINRNLISKIQNWSKKNEHRFRGNYKYNQKFFILGYSSLEYVNLHSILISTCQNLNIEPVIIGDNYTKLIYKTFKIRKYIHSEVNLNRNYIIAYRLLSNIKNIEEYKKLKYLDVSCGKYAFATLIRKTQRIKFHLSNHKDFQLLLFYLEDSISHIKYFKSKFKKFNPDFLLCVDKGYTPEAELFELFLNNKKKIITYNVGHKNNTLVLKSYNKKNYREHFLSLSKKTWLELKNTKLNQKVLNSVKKEIYENYLNQQWYNEVGTCYGSKIYNKQELFKTLKLKTNTKSAVIFPHIFWDGTFFWGKDLFKNYEEWFIETIKAASKNKKVNWIIKIHPANIVKSFRNNDLFYSQELELVKQILGNIPSHFRFIDADTTISSYSLLKYCDYCLTVRGTVGIEASLFGKVVLTAGTGRYDRKGFTFDFNSKKSYLHAVKNIDQLHLKNNNSKLLATKFAYGTFIKRMYQPNTILIRFLKDRYSSLKVKLLFNSQSEFICSNDYQNLKKFIINNDEDFINLNYKK